MSTDALRHPVLRTGEREPIAPYKRRLIYERDGFTCQHCGGIFCLELDHVIPWSANGSDRSDNLRTLCSTCNDERSNYIDPDPPRLVGVTATCYWCWQRDMAPQAVDGADVAQPERIRAYCGRCGTTSWVPSQSWIL